MLCDIGLNYHSLIIFMRVGEANDEKEEEDDEKEEDDDEEKDDEVGNDKEEEKKKENEESDVKNEIGKMELRNEEEEEVEK